MQQLLRGVGTLSLVFILFFCTSGGPYTRGVMILAAFPMLILIVVIAISFRDGEYGIPGVIGAAVAVALGPVIYRMAQYKSAMI
jgi:hypothetical protein